MTQRRKLGGKLLSFLLTLALVLGLMPGISLTVYAAPTEELLTTITATGKEQASYSVENVASVSFSYTTNGSSSYLNKGKTNWGWWGYGWIATVTPADGYTITRCVFYDDANRTAIDSEAPFVVETTEEDKTPRVNGTPIDGGNYQSKGLIKIEVYGYATPAATHSVTITAGDHMTKTTGSGAASQTGLSGAMTDVVYTADDGYYFPENYSVAAVNGISVTRNSYTQITVSGTPSADATITLTAPTAKTTPAAPTTAAATDCTTADNNDGKLTGVTAAMEYKKSDAADWTAGTGSDIIGLVPGTYYVRVKATETTNASTNQELTIKGFISYSVTFKVVNGKWNEGEGDAATADKTVTLTGHDGDTLKLTADQIPAVGTKPNDTYKAGSWDTTPSADTGITADTTYTYTYAQKDSISQTVTFKVVNGSWNDETTTDKTVALTGYEGDILKLAAEDIPAVGTKPNNTYKAGSWDTTPNTDTAITEATTYTYTYAQKDSINQTVTFKVVNGSWNDETTTDKTVTLTGYEGDTLKLAANQIPAVGTKPNDTYKAGSWDVMPSSDAEITGATTYTYTYAQKDSISQTVTFKVVNGSWNDETTTDKTATLTGYEGDTLKLTADQIPTVGTKPNDTYKAGSWDVMPNTDTAITEATTYTYTYAQKDSISQTVTFKVVNGSWNDETTTDKTVTLTGYEGDTLKLAATDIPAVGTKPNDTYKAGSWDVTPSADTEITGATTYTYTYAQKDSISQTVTFKVVNGSWNDETTTDKTVTLTGYEGDTLKLTADQIPTVGTKPNDTYKAGNWDVTPSTDTAITEATTYTYTYVAKEASVVTKAPEAKTLTYNESAQELVTAGTATGGEMQYALGTATEATQPYTTSIPTATDAGTYYVWYKVVGDANHNSTEPNSVEAKINPVDKTDLNTAIEEAEAYYESIKEDDVYAQVAEALKKAIDEAKKYTNDNVAEKEVKEAIDTIKAAKVDAEEGKKETDDTEATKKVTDAINALPASDKIATTDKEAIEAVRKAYDALTADQKKKVSADTLKKLTDAETALKTAQKDAADKTEADKAIEAINKLPASDKVATTDKAAIEAARKAYDALSADQKKQVPADTLKKLTDAEKTLKTAEANDKAAKELATAKAEAQAAMNEQVTVTQKGNKFTVKWKKSSVADGYYVYAGYCGKKATKPVKTIKKNTTTKTTITKIDGKKISTKKNFHVYVVPYKIIDGKKVTLGKSTVAHLVGTKSTKYSNVKTLTLTKKKYTVKVGKTAKVKAKVTLVNKNKKHIPKSHGAKFRYKSSDTSIATVSKNGTIKGIKKGTCTIYVYSINGLVKKAKVTVK